MALRLSFFGTGTGRSPSILWSSFKLGPQIHSVSVKSTLFVFFHATQKLTNCPFHFLCVRPPLRNFLVHVAGNGIYVLNGIYEILLRGPCNMAWLLCEQRNPVLKVMCHVNLHTGTCFVYIRTIPEGPKSTQNSTIGRKFFAMVDLQSLRLGTDFWHPVLKCRRQGEGKENIKVVTISLVWTDIYIIYIYIEKIS